MRNEMVSFTDVALSPFAIDKFCHTVTSSWIIGALFCVGVSAWYLLKHREEILAKESIKIGAIVGLVASLLAAGTGDHSAYQVAQVQPMKLAAMEALYHGGTDQALTGFALVNPFKQADYVNEQEPPYRIAVPYALSYLATHDIHGYVPGINDLIHGYITPEGTKEPSFEQKIERGKLAIQALGKYRQFKKARMGTQAQQQLLVLRENMKYFGYGYVKDVHQLVPPVNLCFWSFRVMVGLGCLFILFFALVLFMVYKHDIRRKKWLLIAAICLIPLGYIASESGWIVAEMGRQPWTIQDMLPTWAAVSDLQANSVITTFMIFLILFTTMLAVEISILCKQINRGPEYSEPMPRSQSNP